VAAGKEIGNTYPDRSKSQKHFWIEMGDTEYQNLLDNGGYFPLTGRTTFSLRGGDRHRLLHNFCTADIKNLAPGKTTEAFVLDGKGKTLWFGLVLSLADRLLLSSHGKFGDRLFSHLDKYILRDDVQLEDLSSANTEFFIFGKQPEKKAKQVLTGLVSQLRVAAIGSNQAEAIQSEPQIALPRQNEVFEEKDVPLVIANAEFAGWGYWFSVPEELGSLLQPSVDQVPLTAANLAQLDRFRIEQGTPWYGCDLDEGNLPQELDRDEKSISFNKGCYLGQETVARIDALGHVNRQLVTLTCNLSQQPVIGDELQHEGKLIGHLTSVAQRESDWVCLAMIRRQFALSGTELMEGTFQVC